MSRIKRFIQEQKSKRENENARELDVHNFRSLDLKELLDKSNDYRYSSNNDH